MDHLMFLAQERLQSVQVNLNSTRGQLGYSIGIWKDGAREYLLNSFHRFQKWDIGSRILERLHGWMQAVKDGRIAFTIHSIYDRCVYFLVTEVTHVHLYFGAMCFIFGGLIGVGIGTRIKESTVAPHKMRAVVANNYEGLESISIVENINAPKIYKPNQILIQVKAASIDYIDIKISEGYGRALRKLLNKYNPNALGELPVTLGRDCSGVVVSTGKEVTAIQPGDEVWLAVPVFCGGTLSEYLVVSDEYVSLKPPQLNHEGAAALPSDIMMAWHALVTRAGLGEFSTAGKRIFIHSGICGISLVAIQLVRAWGGHVTTTVPSHVAALVHSLGADDIIAEESAEMWKILAMREKFDVILNPLGCRESEAQFLQLCCPGGIVVTTAYQCLPEDSFGVLLGTLYTGWLRLKSFVFMDAWLRGVGQYRGEISNKALEQVAPLIATGQLKSVVDRTFGVQDAEFAFTHIAKGRKLGKTVIRFNETYASRNLGIALWQDL